MAVCLLREGEEGRRGELSPETRALPRVTVLNRPIRAAPHWRGTLRARTPTHLSYSQPEREEVWRENFERRMEQQSECGFHGPAHQPYRDVGRVELDDPTLILDGLDQKQDNQTRSPSPTVVTPSPSSHLTPPLPSRPPLRSMAPQLPESVSLLPEGLRGVEGRRGEVRVGRGLFESLTVRERDKQKRTAAQKETGSRVQIAADWKLDESTFDPTMSSSRRTSVQMERRPSTVTFDPVNSSHGNRSRATERRDSSHDVDLENSCHDNLARSVTFVEPLSGSHSNQQECTDRPLTSESPAEQCEEEEVGGGEGVSGENREEEEVAPLQQSAFVHQWYRVLCVLLWVMDGLKHDSPTKLTPFAKCWELNRERVQKAHSLALTRAHTPSSNNIRYDHWKNTAFHQRDENLGRSGQDFTSPGGGHMTSLSPSAYWRRRRETGSREEEKMRKQKRLTVSQMEALVKSVEEELNFTKKANKAMIQRLKGAGFDPPPSPPHTLTPSQTAHPLSLGRVQERFSETEVTKVMTVHQQLSAMERDRSQALEQRLVSLRARHSLWSDLAAMREGVKMETTAMARKKLFMNFNWFQDLLEWLPDEVKSDRYCCHLLTQLTSHAHHSEAVGPEQWSKRRLIGILSSLRPWELRSHETASAVKFLTDHVIYVIPEDYEKWLEYHTISNAHPK